MAKPDRDSPDYAAYKAQKRASREAKKAERETGIGSTSDRNSRSSRKDPNSLSVSGHHSGRHRSTSRDQRSSSRVRISDAYSDNSDGEGNSELSRRSHRRSRSRDDRDSPPPRQRRSSRSPPAEERGPESRSDLRASSPKGQKRSDSNVNTRSFGGALHASANYEYGQPPPQSGGSYIPHSPLGVGGSYDSGQGGYGGHSPVSPISSPGLRPQTYGGGYSYPAPAAYGSGGSGQQPLPPPSPGIYSQNYPPPNPSGYAPPPGGPYSPGPPPSLPQGETHQTPQSGGYPPGPTQLGTSYPSSGHTPGVTGKFTPGQGQAALQSAVPTVFQYQTGGPNIGASTPAPYGGDPTPPPNLDPNHPGPLPGEGAGKVYPPGQAPPQYNNPDYYAHVLSDTATSQSLTHSISTSSVPVKPSYVDGPGGNDGKGKVSSGRISGKLGKLSSLGIPALSSLSLSPNNNPGDSSKPVGLPPPSPALQPYYGTYQSISPMPSPTFRPASSPLFAASGSVSLGGHSAQGSFSLGPPAYPSQKPQKPQKPHHQPSSSISSFHESSSQTSLGFHSRPGYNGDQYSGGSHSPLVQPSGGRYSPTFQSSGGAGGHSSPSRASSPSPERPYNPASDAKAILEELKHTFTRPSPKPLIDVLPTLTPSQLKTLRSEYKSLYRNVNLAKHIKSVFTTSTHFGKVAFAVALGPHESEAWFANSWYQKKETRNELLIESLMGKTNRETAYIKSHFKDAKYDASLEKAVTDELPANKFRIAVMAQLSCGRMEEDQTLNSDRIREDVARLGTILERGSSGGETEMVGIIVNRSDRWLREIAALYRQVYERDLAKAIMKHSKNLVGETLLHILNGAVDKPLRDAKLLDQAITAVLEDDREDLLISRATRIHWDPEHLRRVKRVFKKKYRIDVGTRIISATTGSYRDFLLKMLRED